MYMNRIGFRRASAGKLPAFRLAMLVLLCIGVTAARAETADLGETAERSETWAERLGFPSDKKVVLLHATELGLCYETNTAGTRLLEGDLVRSAAAMAPCPWFGDLADWRKEHPRADLGLSLTLNSPASSYRWKPVAHYSEVPTLTDTDGFLWETPLQTMVNASADQVEREVEAQIAYAKSLGIEPTHFTTHLGTLVTRPDLIEVYLRVARRHWIPSVVVEMTPEHLERFAQAGYPMPEDVIRLMAEYPLPKVDDLRIVASADSYEAKKQAFLDLLRGLSPGITQVAFVPAEESEALKHITNDWQQRVWDAQLMSDDDVRQLLQSDDYILTNWVELMDRFEGAPRQPAEQED